MSQMTTRDQIIEKADRLFYQKGYEQTSFAAIAKALNISRGNFYHHFKTKDAILVAVIEKRMTKTEKMLEEWQIQGSNPKERISSFINILLRNQIPILQYGCPVGTLATELAKLDHPAQTQANDLLQLFQCWLSKQFSELNFQSQADELAMHLLARSQGIAVLANSFRDQIFIRHEVELIHQWLETLTNPANEFSLT